MTRKFLVTEFRYVEADDAIEAEALAAEDEGEMLTVEVDNVIDGRVTTFATMHKIRRLMDAADLVMVPDDLTQRVRETNESDGKDSPYHGLDIIELVERAVETSTWKKGMSNDAIMEDAWFVVDAVLDEAAKGMQPNDAQTFRQRFEALKGEADVDAAAKALKIYREARNARNDLAARSGTGAYGEEEEIRDLTHLLEEIENRYFD